VEIFYYNKRLQRVTAAAAVGCVSREGWKRISERKNVKGRGRPRGRERRGKKEEERETLERTREKQRTFSI